MVNFFSSKPFFISSLDVKTSNDQVKQEIHQLGPIHLQDSLSVSIPIKKEEKWKKVDYVQSHTKMRTPVMTMGQKLTEETKNQEREQDVTALALFSLGISNYKDCPKLYADRFNHLKLNDLMTSDSENVSEIQVTFQNPEMLIEKIDIELPFHSQEGQISWVGGSRVSNYPKDVTMAQINCDYFQAEKHKSYSFSVLADGCGWGHSSQQAACSATAVSSQFINQMLKDSSYLLKTAKEMAWVLVQAIAMSHKALINHPKSGTTTLNICLVFSSSESKKYLLVAGVGDCKVFLAIKDANDSYNVIDVSCSKKVSLDPRDPGGRIGAYEGIHPDLRNLSYRCVALPPEESIILNMSDGLHDNLNPYFLGKEDKKTDFPSTEEERETVSHFQCELLEELINQKTSVIQICQALMEYCDKTTSRLRKFMEDSPHQQEPIDKKQYPGKMDHCSVAVLKV